MENERTREELKKECLGAAIGLVKACESHDPLPTTTPILIETLLVTGKIDIYSEEELADLSERIREEKFSIVPNCRTCVSPCGNTGDYNMKELEERDGIRQMANEALLERLHKAAAEMAGKPEEEIAARAGFLYQGLAAISFDWEPEELDELR